MPPAQPLSYVTLLSWPHSDRVVLTKVGEAQLLPCFYLCLLVYLNPLRKKMLFSARTRISTLKYKLMWSEKKKIRVPKDALGTEFSVKSRCALIHLIYWIKTQVP